MSDAEFKALIDWYASSANWEGWDSLSLESCETINAMVDRECDTRGYRGWADADRQLFAR